MRPGSLAAQQEKRFCPKTADFTSARGALLSRMLIPHPHFKFTHSKLCFFIRRRGADMRPEPRKRRFSEERQSLPNRSYFGETLPDGIWVRKVSRTTFNTMLKSFRHILIIKSCLEGSVRELHETDPTSASARCAVKIRAYYLTCHVMILTEPTLDSMMM
jgi:hypothetical protein